MSRSSTDVLLGFTVAAVGVLGFLLYNTSKQVDRIDDELFDLSMDHDDLASAHENLSTDFDALWDDYYGPGEPEPDGGLDVPVEIPNDNAVSATVTTLKKRGSKAA